MNELSYGSTYHCRTEVLCDHLGQCHCKDHSQLYSLYNTKLRHQIQFLRARRHQVLNMKRGTHRYVTKLHDDQKNGSYHGQLYLSAK